MALSLQKGGNLNKVLDDIKQQYRNAQEEVRARYKIKGGKTTGTEREQRLLANQGIEIKIQTK